MFFAAPLFAIALLSTVATPATAPAERSADHVEAPLLASPRPESAPLPVQQLRACQDARLAIGIPLEAPSGVLSDIVRIDVLSSLRISRPLGLVYSLRNGREFFGLASSVLKDPAIREATSEFLRGATFGSHSSGVDVSNDGYSVDPIVIDNRRLPTLGLDRLNCAAVRVL